MLAATFTGVLGAGTGFLLGRNSQFGTRKMLNGNQRWMNKQERSIVTTLINSGQGHLFRNWPPPGVNDDKKRALLQALTDKFSGEPSSSMESMRLEVLKPPIAEKRPKVITTTHGDTRTDDYFWLRDDKRQDKAVLAHLHAENKYTKTVMADTEKLQEELYQEMRKRIQEADQSVPVRRCGYYYYSRTLEGAQYRVSCRRKVPDSAGPPTEADALDESTSEEIIMDENKRKEELKCEFYMVGGAEVSPNDELLAYSEDTVGGEKYTLRVKNISTGAEIMTPIPATSGDVEWAADNQTLFYVVKDHLDRPYKVLRHVIGQPCSSDVVVHEEKDDSFYVGLAKSRSEEVIFISCGSAVTSEERYILASEPMSDFKVIKPREQDVEYSVMHRGSHFFITLRDKARPNSELSVAPMADLSAAKVLLPHSDEIKLESVSVSANYVSVFDRFNGLQRARVFKLPTDNVAPSSLADGDEVTFEEPTYELSCGHQGDFDSAILRLSYSSLTTPTSTIDYNMLTGVRAVKKVQPVLGGFNKEAYKTERLWATSHDGVKIPISVVYKTSLAKLDGSDPLLLDGYGSYEICNDAYFNSSRLCLLDRGFVFAVAHIRGGGEMGRMWYENGKYLNKKNTFHDFIACAEHLIANKYTSSEHLAIEGRSAGGLLIGAVVNMRPELFKSAIMGVPFVDVLCTMEDETIPLTIIEWEEWGNPENKEYYDYMKSYSPMDNTRAGAEYPHILATGGLHDPRVGYWEPSKFVAKLREVAKPGNLLLLKMDIGAGHFSVTGRFERLKETAFEFAYLLKTLGKLQDAPAAPSKL